MRKAWEGTNWEMLSVRLKKIKNSVLDIYEMPNRNLCGDCPVCEFSSLCFMENLSGKLISSY